MLRKCNYKITISIFLSFCVLCILFNMKFYHLHAPLSDKSTIESRKGKVAHIPQDRPIVSFNSSADQSTNTDIQRQPTKPVAPPSMFMVKPELQGATVFTRSATTWSRDDVSCNGDPIFQKVIFHSPAGMTPMYVHPAKIDKYVSAAVINGGVWEQAFVNKIYNLFKSRPNMDFVDIGANIGIYGITVAMLGRRVVLVDPLLKDVRKLCNTVRYGKFKDVFVIHNAMSSDRFNVGFLPHDGNIGATYIRNATSNDTDTAFAILLDDTLEIFNFTKPVALKIDVETHEHRVLLGAEKFFTMVDVRFILMEWGVDKKDTGHTVVDFLTRFNMKPFHPNSDAALDPKQYKKWFGEVFWKKNV